MLTKIIEFLYKAGDKLLSAHCADSEIDIKPGEANFVTAHDIAMQEYIKKSMLELFPDAAFMGEESELGFRREMQRNLREIRLDTETGPSCM